MNHIHTFPYSLCLTIMCIVFITVTATAQDQSPDPKQVRVETTDGNVFTGTLVSEDENRIIVRTSTLGEITIERSRIRRITEIDDSRMRNGKYWYDNPQSTRYFFAPNALGLPKDKGYYQNVWIFFNNVNYGVSDNFSIGGGIVPMFLFGVGETPVWVLPKVSIPVGSDQFHLAAGAMLGGVVGSGDSDIAGVFYGMGTFGDRDRNLSLGLGYGYSSGEISSTPVITISGMYRANQSIYYISENYFFPGTDEMGIISFGVRWAPENFAVDFSLFRPLEAGNGFIGLPWLGVTIPFGK